MKPHLILIFLLVCCVFSACDLTGNSNATPQISFYKIPQLNTKDSLNIRYTADAGVWKLDTISVGDTVTFRIMLDGFSNNLTTFYLTCSDTTSTKLILPSKTSMDSLFNTAYSNFNDGKFIFKSGIKNLYFPFRYIATKENNDARISFSLSSDAKFDGGMNVGSNMSSFTLKTPIKSKKTAALLIQRRHR